MKLREVATPVVLIALALAAGAYALLVDRAAISDADRAARRRDVFPTFRVEDVTRVELAQPGGSLVLERDRAGSGAGAAWTIASPRPGPADPGAVDALLRELEMATRVRDVDEGAAAGLSSPRVRGTITMGPMVLRFALGADAPRPEGAAYLRVEGEAACVVGRSLRTQLLRDADSYRVRALVPYGESAALRVELSATGTPPVTLERHGATFRLRAAGSSADDVRADRAAVEHVFAALADARAESFLDDDVGDRALAESARAVLIPRDGSQPRVELRVGGPCPGHPDLVVAVRTAPTHVAACVPRALAAALDPTAAVVDTAVLFAHADEIEELRLEDPSASTRVDLARRGAGWHERAPAERDLDREESDGANLLAADLAAARATEVLGPHAPGAGHALSPRTRATVVRTGGSSTEVIELAAPDESGAAWARRVDDGALLHLDADAVRRLQPHPVALRAHAVWRREVDPAQLVAIDSTCGPVAERLERAPSGWRLRRPAGFEADPLAAGDLAAALARARADAWLTESDDGRFGLDREGACHVVLTLDAPDGGVARALTLTFGAAADASGTGFFARASDDPAVFVLPASVRAIAAHPVVDRRLLRIDPARVRGLRLVQGGKPRALDLETDAGARALEAAASLRVRAALHTGRPAPGEGLDTSVLELEVTERAGGAEGASDATDAAGADEVRRLRFGATATIDGAEGYYARAAGLDVTFFVARPAVDELLQLAGASGAP